jgi:UDP-GlcNAc:undecaprenyl-phosphate/decaprenyl-phosphate GlcNAc-1-phosphate transferase
MVLSKLQETIAFAVALGCVVALVPVIGRICARWGIFDQPGHLKIHREPIPRLGGVAIACGLVAGVVSAVHGARSGAVFFAATFGLVWLAGFVDDLRGLPPAFRLLAQIAGALLLYAGGWRVTLSSSVPFAIVAQCLYVILFVNAFNFLDGADGLAAGITGVIALGYAVIAGYALSAYGQAVVWSLLGACIGFVVFNFPPAKIFMGDSGSTVLGFSVAFLGLDFIAAHRDVGATRARLFVLLIASLPLLDALVVVLRRVMKGKSAFRGDRGHFYDYLMGAGWQARTIAIASYLLTAFLALMGWLVTQGSWKNPVLLATGLLAALLLAVFWLGALRPNAMKQTRYRTQL